MYLRVFGVTRGLRFRGRSTLLLPLELCHDKDIVVDAVITAILSVCMRMCVYRTQVEAGQIQSKRCSPAPWLTTSHLPEIILIIHGEEEGEGSGRAEEFAL